MARRYVPPNDGGHPQPLGRRANASLPYQRFVVVFDSTRFTVSGGVYLARTVAARFIEAIPCSTVSSGVVLKERNAPLQVTASANDAASSGLGKSRIAIRSTSP